LYLSTLSEVPAGGQPSLPTCRAFTCQCDPNIPDSPLKGTPSSFSSTQGRKWGVLIFWYGKTERFGWYALRRRAWLLS